MVQDVHVDADYTTWDSCNNKDQKVLQCKELKTLLEQLGVTSCLGA